MYKRISNNLKIIIRHKEVFNFINYYIFTIINAGIGVFSISFLTKLISPEHYGLIGIYTSIIFFVPSLISFSVNGLQAIEIVNLEYDDYVIFRNTYISFVLISSVMSIIISIAASILMLTADFAFVVIAAVLMGLIQTLASIHNTELFQNSKPTQFGMISTSTAVMSIVLTVIFLYVFKLDWKFRIIALLVTEFVVLILRFYVFSTIGRDFKFIYNKIQFKYFLRYGFPLIISLMAGWVLNQSDRFFLLRYFTLKEVGFYSAAAGLAAFIILFNTNMIKVLYPLVYKKLSLKEGKLFIIKVTTIYSIIIILLSCLFCMTLHFFGHYFLGKKYLQAMPVVYIMCFAQAFFGVYSTTGLVIDYFKLTQLKTVLIVSCAVVIITLSYILIHLIGFLGPAIAGLASYLLLSIWSFFISLKLFKKHNIV